MDREVVLVDQAEADEYRLGVVPVELRLGGRPEFRSPSIRCVPIADMPEWETAPVWRKDNSDRRLRAFVESAEEILARVTQE